MTTWLTVITPDRRRPEVTHDLDDINRLHQRIMQLYPPDLGTSARAAAGVLFRVDEDISKLAILMQSSIKPDPSRLPEYYGQFAMRPLDPLLDAMRVGFPVRYRLTANATRKLGRNTQVGRPLTVVPLYGQDAEHWWARKAVDAGLELRTISVTGLGWARGRRRLPHEATTQHVQHARTRFDGTALISDADRLRTALISGIGRAKSYGCGLLTIAPTK